jgi:hypothetical protein
MELLKKVSRLEAKRCFVLSQRFTSKQMRKDAVKKHMIKPSQKTITENIKTQTTKIIKMSEDQLDHVIGTEYKKRLKAYNSVEWYLGSVDASEVGVWRGAGGLPKSWTRGSVKETARKLFEEMNKKNFQHPRVRAARVVPKILEIKSILKKQKYLLPIILSSGTIKGARKGMKKMKGDIDDGCMRSLAFVGTGDEKIRAYIGIAPKGFRGI